MTLKNGRASTRKDIVDSGHAVSGSRRQFVASLVEAGVEHFVVVAAEFFNALACAHVPQTRCPVNTARQAVITSKIELAAREFS